MITKKMQDEINKQINAELYSSYLYISMSAYFESLNLNGFSHWMKVQAQEEWIHAMKLYNYVNERGGWVTLTEIEAPPTEWKSPLNVFEQAYKHEQKVTSLINNLVELAITEKDHATNNMLQWFVEEQVEEEASADKIVQKLKLIGDAPGGTYMLDNELGGRPEKWPLTFTESAGE